MRTVAACFIIVGQVVGAAYSAPALSVRYESDRLSVSSDNIPLRDLLSAVASEVRMQVNGHIDSERRISVRLNECMLEEALKRILGRQSFTLEYEGTRAVRLTIWSAAKEVGMVGFGERNPSPSGNRSAGDPSLSVPVSGALAKRLGGRTTPWGDLVEVAGRDPDPAMRRRALRTVMHFLSENPDARHRLFASMRTMDDATIANLARDSTGTDGVDILRMARRSLRSPDIRSRIDSILRLLREEASMRSRSGTP